MEYWSVFPLNHRLNFTQRRRDTRLLHLWCIQVLSVLQETQPWELMASCVDISGDPLPPSPPVWMD